MSKVIDSIRSRYSTNDTNIRKQLFLSACTGGCSDYIEYYAGMILDTDKDNVFNEAFKLVKNKTTRNLLVQLVTRNRANVPNVTDGNSIERN